MYDVIALASAILLAAILGLTVSRHLRPALARVLDDTCERGHGGHFWLRYSDLMMVITPVVLQLALAPSQLERLSPSLQLRWLLGLALLGVLAGLVIVGRAVWRSIHTTALEQQTTKPTGMATPTGAGFKP